MRLLEALEAKTSHEVWEEGLVPLIEEEAAATAASATTTTTAWRQKEEKISASALLTIRDSRREVITQLRPRPQEIMSSAVKDNKTVNAESECNNDVKNLLNVKSQNAETGSHRKTNVQDVGTLHYDGRSNSLFQKHGVRFLEGCYNSQKHDTFRKWVQRHGKARQ